MPAATATPARANMSPASGGIPPAPPPLNRPTTAAMAISRRLSSAPRTISAGWSRRGYESSELIGLPRQYGDPVPDRNGVLGAQGRDLVRVRRGVHGYGAQVEEIRERSAPRVDVLHSRHWDQRARDHHRPPQQVDLLITHLVAPRPPPQHRQNEPTQEDDADRERPGEPRQHTRRVASRQRAPADHQADPGRHGPSERAEHEQAAGLRREGLAGLRRRGFD